jgi:hypothetical protein
MADSGVAVYGHETDTIFWIRSDHETKKASCGVGMLFLLLVKMSKSFPFQLSVVG